MEKKLHLRLVLLLVSLILLVIPSLTAQEEVLVSCPPGTYATGIGGSYDKTFSDTSVINQFYLHCEKRITTIAGNSDAVGGSLTGYYTEECPKIIDSDGSIGLTGFKVYRDAGKVVGLQPICEGNILDETVFGINPDDVEYNMCQDLKTGISSISVTVSDEGFITDIAPVTPHCTVDLTYQQTEKLSETFDCAGKRIGIIGASNTVSKVGGSSAHGWPDSLAEYCPGATFIVQAESGFNPKKMLEEKFMENVLKENPDIIIISPSGNLPGDVSISHLTPLTAMIEQAQDKNIPVGVLTISPRKGYELGTVKWSMEYQEKVNDFNTQVKTIPGATVIDIYSVLATSTDSDDSDVCGFCTDSPGNTGVHWTEQGDDLVAEAIVNQFFNTNLATVHLPAAQPGIPTAQELKTAGVSINALKNCVNPERCEEIDEVWARISQKIGRRIGQIYIADEGWRTVGEAARGVLPEITSFLEDQVIDSAVAESYKYETISSKKNSVLATMHKINILYGDLIKTAEQKHEVPASLLIALISVESSGNPHAVSSGSAAGLMQFVPATFIDQGGKVAYKDIELPQFNSGKEYKDYLEQNHLWIDGKSPCNSAKLNFCDYVNDQRFNPTISIDLGAQYLKYLFDKNNCGTWLCALASYNQGPGGKEKQEAKDYAKEILGRQALFLEDVVTKLKSAVAVSSAKWCFPLMEDSYHLISFNWGSPRSNGDRCHAGIDIFTKDPGIVLAIDDGVVTSIANFKTCKIDDKLDDWGLKKEELSSGATKNVLIYHPTLGKTVNYGELNENKIYVKNGQTITKSQPLGIASYCGMLHLELYEGEVDDAQKWLPPQNSKVQSANQCALEENYLNTKHPTLLDPTGFVKSLEGRFCTPIADSVS